MTFNPLRDIALWTGEFSPTQDMIVTYQLMGFMLSFLLFALVSLLVGSAVQRIYFRVTRRQKALRKWYGY